jgi:hypothetical protein
MFDTFMLPFSIRLSVPNVGIFRGGKQNVPMRHLVISSWLSFDDESSHPIHLLYSVGTGGYLNVISRCSAG